MKTPALALLLALLLPACEDVQVPSAPVDRDTFVATWIDLRLAALASRSGRIEPAQREQVLEANGVTEEDLLAFVEVHGRDVDYMREVWQEVEARMDSLDAPPVGGG